VANSSFDENYPLVIQLVAIDDTGDSFHRMAWPAMALAQAAPHLRVVNLDYRASERFILAECADLFVAIQSSDCSILPLIRSRKARGKKTLVEYNDNFYEPPSWSPVAKNWSSPILWQTYEDFMNLSDGVIVTGEGLYELFKKSIANTSVTILENHLYETPPPLEYLLQKKPLREQKVVLGWAGSLGHMADILALVPTLEELLSQHSPTLAIHLMGNEALPTSIRLAKERVVYTSWGSIHNYLEFWNDVSLGIVPLLPTAYNECRSDIKPVEMVSRGVLPLLPDFLPYKKFIASCSLPSWKTNRDFIELAKLYINNHEKYKEDLSNCYNYVVKERVHSLRNERLELYTKNIHHKKKQTRHPLIPDKPGYYEVSGTLTQISPNFLLRQKAESLWKSGEKTAAINILSEKAVDDDPDIALVRANYLLFIDKITAHDYLNKCRKRFPNDLRFILLIATTAQSNSFQLEQWEIVVNCLSNNSHHYQQYFRELVTQVFTRNLPKNSILITIGLSLVKIFPQYAPLLASVAAELEKQGDDSASEEIYARVRELITLTQQNASYCSNIDYGFFDAWTCALQGRSHFLRS